MGKRSKEKASKKTMKMVNKLKAAGEAPELPERWSSRGIEERREYVAKFYARRVPQTVIAKLLGVSTRTISNDIEYLKKERSEYIEQLMKSQDATFADIGTAAMRLESIAQAALGQYELAKSDRQKNQYLITAIKAETARNALLINTGVLPKAGEDLRITHNAGEPFTSKVGNEHPLSTLDNPASRRRVLEAAEKIINLGAKKLEPKPVDQSKVKVKGSHNGE